MDIILRLKALFILAYGIAIGKPKEHFQAEGLLYINLGLRSMKL